MKGKTLASVILAGAIILSSIGCGKKQDLSEYYFCGEIGEEKVEFRDHDYLFGKHNVLTVKKNDGRVIRYVDWDTDLILDEVEIIKEDQNTRYQLFNDYDKPILEEAQKQFDEYLPKIKGLRLKQGLENLK